MSNEVERVEVVWNVDDNEIPESLSGLVQIHSDKMAVSLRCHASVVCLVHAVWLTLNAKRRRFLVDKVYTLLGFVTTESE